MFDWKRVLIAAFIGAWLLTAAGEEKKTTRPAPEAKRSHQEGGTDQRDGD